MRRRMLLFAPLAIVGFIAFLAVGGLVVMWLWNALAPTVFGLRMVTFWQALGLLALCRILFGGVAGPRGPRMDMRRRMADRMADRVADRWDRMSPEERERFRDRLRNRCGFDVGSTA